ncbi:monooxygenase [Fusarium falciforme]|nr:monooxygenase [Fusarium falciforme]
MESWVKKEHIQKGEGKPIHIINFPEDVKYMERLYDLSATAVRAPELGLENGGDGKRPPCWDPQQVWIRGKVGEIKQASRLAGDRRFNITSHEELGFFYEKPNENGENGTA